MHLRFVSLSSESNSNAREKLTTIFRYFKKGRHMKLVWKAAMLTAIPLTLHEASLNLGQPQRG